MGRFDERATDPGGPRDLLRWQLDRIRQPKARRPFEMRVRAADPSVLDAERSSLTWVGHASFVLRLAGVTVVTDPIWRKRLGVRQRTVPPATADAVAERAEIADHAQPLRPPRRLTIQARGEADAHRSVGTPAHCAERRDASSRSIAADASRRRAEITVPARHWSMRAPWNRNEALWGGFVFRGPEGAAYHSGDTALFDGFAEIGERAGPIAWAMLPIGAYEPRWFMECKCLPRRGRPCLELLGARHLQRCTGHVFAHRRAGAEPAERLLARPVSVLSADRVGADGETRPLVREAVIAAVARSCRKSVDDRDQLSKNGAQSVAATSP
jgi:L-ascorbate metabolism protein UlaG (beta-lactamase superfamily)